MASVGVDVGGTKIEAAVLDDSHNVVLRKRVPTPGGGRRHEDIADAICGLVRDLRSDSAADCDDAAIGIGLPGSPSSEHATYVREILKESLSSEIFVENDANCFAMAEAAMGAGRGYRTVFGVIMGTGVGGGIVIDGAIQHGRTGLAGEWGHIPVHRDGLPCSCGRRGCAIMYISGPALERRWTEISGSAETVPDIVSSSAALNSNHGRAWKGGFLDDFGRGLAGVISMLDPDVIVVGGGLSNIPFLYGQGAGSVRRHALYGDAPPILQNELGDSAGVLGAALLAEGRPSGQAKMPA